jgi:hypothetical protein
VRGRSRVRERERAIPPARGVRRGYAVARGEIEGDGLVVRERGGPELLSRHQVGVEAEQTVGVAVRRALAAPQRGRAVVQGAARREQPDARTERALQARLRAHQIERAPTAQAIARGRARAQVEDVGEAPVVARGRAADVQRRAADRRRVEAREQSAEMERRVHGSAVEQHELEVRGRAAHEQRVAGVRRIVASAFSSARGAP